MSNARQVRVLVAAVYNDPNHRALPFADVGEDIEIAGGDYAEWLREQGMVVFVDTSSERAMLEREIAELKEHMDLLELEQQVAHETVNNDLDDKVDDVTEEARKPKTGRQGNKVK